jgi:hypothetical protein
MFGLFFFYGFTKNFTGLVQVSAVTYFHRQGGLQPLVIVVHGRQGVGGMFRKMITRQAGRIKTATDFVNILTTN